MLSDLQDSVIVTLQQGQYLYLWFLFLLDYLKELTNCLLQVFHSPTR